MVRSPQPRAHHHQQPRNRAVYVGRPHPQTDRRIEVIAEIRQPDTVVIFHVMEVSDLYRHLIKETP